MPRTLVVYVSDAIPTRSAVLRACAGGGRSRSSRWRSAAPRTAGVRRMTVVVDTDQAGGTGSSRQQPGFWWTVGPRTSPTLHGPPRPGDDQGREKPRETPRRHQLQLVQVFRARVVDVAARLARHRDDGDRGQGGRPACKVLRPFGVMEMVRTGRVVMCRGSQDRRHRPPRGRRRPPPPPPPPRRTNVAKFPGNGAERTRMATMYYDKDARPVAHYQGARVAIIGPGSQGTPTCAQPARQRRPRVGSGLPSASRSRPGRRPRDSTSPPRRPTPQWSRRHDAAGTPDTAQPAPPLYPSAISGPTTRPGRVLMFAHGYQHIRFGTIAPPPGRGRRDGGAQVAGPPRPRGLRRGGRDAGVAGRSIATPPGAGARRWRSPAPQGIGATRAGVIETTFAGETETDLFGDAGRAVRQRQRAGQSQASRRWSTRQLPAHGDRLLRVPPGCVD